MSNFYKWSTFFKSLLTLTLFLFFAHSAQATPLAQDCTTALTTPKFQALAHYLDGNQHKLERDNNFDEYVGEPDKCISLGRSQFFVLPKSDGYHDHLYYCDFKNKTDCVAYPNKSRVYPNIEVILEFEDNHGKHFVLIKQSRVEHAIGNTAYNIFYLNPKATPPFSLQELSGDDNIDNMLCAKGDYYNKEDMEDFTAPRFPKITTVIGRYHIVNAGKKNVSLVFEMSKADCRSGKVTHFKERYVFHNDRFIKRN